MTPFLIPFLIFLIPKISPRSLSPVPYPALAWFELGDLDQARRTMEARKTYLETRETASFNDFSNYWAELALIYALEGSSEKAETLIEQSREAKAIDLGYLSLRNLELRAALAYLVMGQNEKAIDSLEQASGQKGCELLNRQLQLWPFFDRLRGNPRFDALLQD